MTTTTINSRNPRTIERETPRRKMKLKVDFKLPTKNTKTRKLENYSLCRFLPTKKKSRSEHSDRNCTGTDPECSDCSDASRKDKNPSNFTFLSFSFRLLSHHWISLPMVLVVISGCRLHSLPTYQPMPTISRHPSYLGRIREGFFCCWVDHICFSSLYFS